MEEQKPNAASSASKNARRGFFLMLGGPCVLVIPTFIDFIGYVPDVFAVIFSGAAIILPGIGAILCIASLIKGKLLDKTGRALSIITIVMCNPLFYLVYMAICSAGGHGLAQMSFM
jgi:hypothetical protein